VKLIQEANMTAADWFVKGLMERGVTWMATLCGHGLDPLFHAARCAGMRLVDTRNEQTASYMADFAGRLSRRVAVCAVSSGVAHANALSGLVSAYFDGSPMLLVSGAGLLRTAGMGHFQDFDQVSLVRSVTRYARVVDRAERAVQILDEAMRATAFPSPGPAHLTFPMDIQTTEVAENALIPPVAVGSWRAVEGDPDAVGHDLAASRRPLIVAGSGSYYAGDGAKLMQLSERYLIPIVVPIWDRGIVDWHARTFLGVIGAATGGPRLLEDADCILMAGAVADYRVGFLQPGAVHPSAKVHFLNHGWDRLGSVYERYGGLQHDAWLFELRRRREEFRAAVRRTGMAQARRGTHAIHVVDAVRRALTQETILLIDGGSIGQWVHQLLCDFYPGYWLTCGRSGVVGWGIGGAMAARLIYPNRPVLLVSGDGSFTFNVAELECAVRQKLPFVALVADDRGWGITRAGHIKQFGEPIGSDLGPVDVAKLAEALGADGVRVHDAEAIAPTLEKALKSNRVTVIHVPIVGGNP
jgi:acetolactate synthase-1/2/3 large subunit